ncbi:hypothetical protein OROGR_007886 [Orobanche gracilis]
MFRRVINPSMAANHYSNTIQNNSSSCPPQEPDEISLFLQQIILRSYSSPSSLTRQQPFASAYPNQGFAVDSGSGQDQISVPDPSAVFNSSSACSFTAANVSSSSIGKLDNEADEYDYESEEVIEAVVEETAPKPTPPRSSSKRSRAAEVHNLSEKRRRSRINEKMKALQNLIPNSNKTDKASMLDEAIEYLKQLQLQVQMLTMRNGLSVYPICVPGTVPPPNQMFHTRMDIYNDADKFSEMDQNVSVDTLLGIGDKCVKQAPDIDFSSMVGSKNSVQVESSMHDHFDTFQRHESSKGICHEKVPLCHPVREGRPQTSSTGEQKRLRQSPVKQLYPLRRSIH